MEASFWPQLFHNYGTLAAGVLHDHPQWLFEPSFSNIDSDLLVKQESVHRPGNYWTLH